jgi:hypothetical protein
VHIDEHNSAAPEVEAAVLREQSYGRQLGQIMDGGGALFPPIAESRTMNPTTPPTIHGHFRVFFGAGGGAQPCGG